MASSDRALDDLSDRASDHLSDGLSGRPPHACVRAFSDRLLATPATPATGKSTLMGRLLLQCGEVHACPRPAPTPNSPIPPSPKSQSAKRAPPRHSPPTIHHNSASPHVKSLSGRLHRGPDPNSYPNPHLQSRRWTPAPCTSTRASRSSRARVPLGLHADLTPRTLTPIPNPTSIPNPNPHSAGPSPLSRTNSHPKPHLHSQVCVGHGPGRGGASTRRHHRRTARRCARALARRLACLRPRSAAWYPLGRHRPSSNACVRASGCALIRPRSDAARLSSVASACAREAPW